MVDNIINKMLETQNIKYLVVHCSDTPDEKDLNGCDIHKMHIGFGWNGIGYHKIILRNGDIESGRPEYWKGAHAYGYNDKSLGVCLIGRKNFNSSQLITLGLLLDNWKQKYPNSHIVGHNEITKSGKTCPNFDIQDWLIKRSKNAIKNKTNN
ncbi:N-acetylmuramoyl-L-alanine amidase [Alphaproteobacteria bacterium]|nr:N-acetylmuramoyl-L-alanine amidase [Alphaproteobacteria bacterium]